MPRKAQKMTDAAAPVRLLLADDDRVIVATLAEALREQGFEVATAANGEEAVAVCEAQLPALAIMDIRMPRLDGIEAARRVRERFGVPVLFLSAYSDRAQVDQAVAEGALGYLVKPVNCERLLPAITTALARGREFRDAEAAQRRLTQALDSKREVDIAIGLLIERFNLNRDTAYDVLRRMTRSRNMKLNEMAVELVRSRELYSEAQQIAAELIGR
jgi:response regulator NasT